jgi:hypothetical protein
VAALSERSGEMQIENDEPEIMERVTALDVGKAEVVVCGRCPARAAGGCRRSAPSRR